MDAFDLSLLHARSETSRPESTRAVASAVVIAGAFGLELAGAVAVVCRYLRRTVERRTIVGVAERKPGATTEERQLIAAVDAIWNGANYDPHWATEVAAWLEDWTDGFTVEYLTLDLLSEVAGLDAWETLSGANGDPADLYPAGWEATS